MPLDIGNVGASVIGTFGQQVAQAGGQQNMFNSNMLHYGIQRQDALNDWKAQQEYNSPVNMVSRLKQAGMSPHMLGGQASLVAAGKAEQQRPSQFGNIIPSQAGGGLNSIQMLQGLEQLKLMKAQTAKTEAETQSVNSDVKSKGLNYMVDDKTLLDTKVAERMMKQAQVESSQADTKVKTQQLENMKVEVNNMLEQAKINKIEATYREPLLLGKVNLQKREAEKQEAEINRIQAEIRNLNTRTDEERKTLPYKLQKLQQEIAALKLDNEQGNIRNQQLPDKLINENNLLKENLKGKKWDNDYKGTIDPQLQRLIDYGGDKVSQFTKFGKLQQVQPSLRHRLH